VKISVSIVLFLFMSFIALPTIVSIVKADVDLSMVYACAEEEDTSSFSEIKEVVKAVASIFKLELIQTDSSQMFRFITPSESSYLLEIPLPPPELA
jgi:hypothetical protein